MTSIYKVIDDLLFISERDSVNESPIFIQSLYTPSWTGSTTNPVLNNGNLKGSYTRIGNLVIGSIGLVCGSTTTFGSGIYEFTIPIQCAWNAGIYSFGGTAFIVDYGTRYWVGQIGASYSDPMTKFYMLVGDGSGGYVGNVFPMTFADGDEIIINFQYMLV